MNKQLQTVYIPTNGETEVILAEYETGSYLEGLKQIKEAYIFTPEELKQLLEEYTDRIVKNAETKEVYAPSCDDHTPYRGACVSCGSYSNPDILVGSEVDKESITSQLPKFLKEQGYE